MGYSVDEHAVNVFDSIAGSVYTTLWVIPNVVLYCLGPPPGAFRSRALRISRSRSTVGLFALLCGGLVWARGALNRPKTAASGTPAKNGSSSTASTSSAR